MSRSSHKRLTISCLAETLGVNRRTVARLLRTGVPGIERTGRASWRILDNSAFNLWTAEYFGSRNYALVVQNWLRSDAALEDVQSRISKAKP
jgi:hypothetical protein